VPSPETVLGELIAEARLERGLTQAALAQQVGLGTSTVRAIENGKAPGPSLYSVLALLDVLGLPLEDLEAVREAASTPERMERRVTAHSRRSQPRRRS
jgi:transcriptional regulator with XRE-family HTH domain